MKISIVGCGYVGLCTGVGLASIGHEVVAVDLDKNKVDNINMGIPPIYEAGLEEMLKQVSSFRATTDMAEIRCTDVTFIAVGTPSREDGSIDTSYIEQAAQSIASAIRDKDKHIVVVKSTVVPGTSDKVSEIIEKTAGKRFDVAMNPEFLREGSAIRDFLEPDSIVIGGEPHVTEKIAGIYAPLNKKILKVSLKTAEMIKYAKNAYLAKDISFANEIANICERMGIDYEDVKKGLSEDSRIGKFVHAGVGYGGSCFGKDVQALIKAAEDAGHEPRLLKEAHELNERQKLRIVEILENAMDVKGKSIGILGLAFKPGTDDVREAPSVVVIRKLLEKGANVSVYDPQAMENIKRIFGDSINYTTREECLDKDAVLILTEWNEFRDIRPEQVKSIIVDGRRILNKNDFPAGKYYGIGLGK